VKADEVRAIMETEEVSDVEWKGFLEEERDGDDDDDNNESNEKLLFPLNLLVQGHQWVIFDQPLTANTIFKVPDPLPFDMYLLNVE